MIGALPSSVSFTATQGGAAPPLQVVHIFAQPATSPQSFAVAIDDGFGQTAPSWIQVSPLTATTPALLTVTVDQSNLAPSTYSARIRVSVPNSPNLPVTNIPVTLVVNSVAPILDLAPNLLRFTTRSGSPGQHTGTVLLSDNGGGSIAFSTSVVNRSAWITNISAGSVAGPRTPAVIRVTVDSTGLQPGIYRDTLRIASNSCPIDRPQACDVPIILRVAPAGPLLRTSRTGVRFVQRPGFVTPVTRDVRISNSDPGSSLSWTAELVRGADWFTLSPTTGSASQASPSILQIGVKSSTSGLSVGSYYGLVRINAPGASNPTQYIVAVLQVLGTNEPTGIDVDTGGVVLTSTTRSTQTVRTNVTVNIDSAAPTPFQVAAADDVGNWLSVSPTSGNASGGAESDHHDHRGFAPAQCWNLYRLGDHRLRGHQPGRERHVHRHRHGLRSDVQRYASPRRRMQSQSRRHRDHRYAGQLLHPRRLAVHHHRASPR
ncbi:MAG: hypothetical protein WDO18_05330 [Acidobacteriota bacterium]